MSATSIMDPNPTVVKSTDIIRTAINYIMENRYRNLPVVDDDGHYLGSFGVNCLLKNVLPKAAVIKQGLGDVSFVQESLADLHNRLRKFENKPVEMYMATDSETVSPETPLVESLFILYKTRDSLPVVDTDSGKLLGVISYFDAGEKILSA